MTRIPFFDLTPTHDWPVALASLPGRMLTAVLKRLGTQDVKARIWDREYRRGQHDYHAPPAIADILIPVIDREGSVLDVGCGRADIRRLLASRGWKGRYVGVDTSSVALEMAAREPGNCTFRLASMESYEPDALFEAIMFLESINYVPVLAVPRMLRKYRTHLAPDGVMLIRTWDVEKHWMYDRTIRAAFPDVEVQRTGSTSYHIIRAHPSPKPSPQGPPQAAHGD